jgi:hypothetical protein
MSELQFHVIGDSVRIGDYTYSKQNLERRQPQNVVGLSRYNRRTDQWEMYNPHTEGPTADRHSE